MYEGGIGLIEMDRFGGINDVDTGSGTCFGEVDV